MPCSPARSFRAPDARRGGPHHVRQAGPDQLHRTIDAAGAFCHRGRRLRWAGDARWNQRRQGRRRRTQHIARLKTITEGGKVRPAANQLRVEGANAVTLLLTAATDYRLRPPAYRGNPARKADRRTVGRRGRDTLRRIAPDAHGDYPNSSAGCRSIWEDATPAASHRRAIAPHRQAEDARPRPGGVVLPIRPLSADFQFLARRLARQFAGHLGRWPANAVELRLSHRHQRADELYGRSR